MEKEGETSVHTANVDNTAEPVDISTMEKDELLALGARYVEELLFDKASQVYELLLKRFGELEEILIPYGYFAFNSKDVEKAKVLLLKSVAQSPNENPKKYFHLGQLHSAKEALYFYSQGIEIIQNALANIEEHQVEDQLKKDITTDLSQAYSAIAELYMTDLSKEPNAQEVCRLALEKCLQIDPECLDGFYQLSQYHLNTDNPEEARPLLKKIVDVYRKLDEKEEEDEDYTEEFMMQVVRALIEVEEWSDAEYMLEQMLKEDDKNNETLYLMSFVLFKQGHYRNVMEYLSTVNPKTLKHDPELVEACRELEAELKAKLATLPPEEDGEEGGEGKGDMDIEDGDEWEDEEEKS